MKKTNLDTTKLKQVTDASRTATTTMILLGFRQRAHGFTSLATVKNQLLEMGEKIVDRDYMEFWRGLEDAGAGQVILGRRGKQTRFEWNYSLRKIASVAIEGKKDQIERLANKKARTYHKKAAPTLPIAAVAPVLPVGDAGTARKEERLVYSIQLRPGHVIEVAVPVDVSREELETIRNSFFLGAGV